MGEGPKLWERQPWDSDASFACFQIWLLQDQRPRSLDAAYRVYVGRERYANGTLIRTSDHARRWYQAKDGKGRPIEGAATWEQRAAAWDDFQAELDRLKWQQRHRALREQDWTAGEDLRQLAAQIMSHAPQFLKTTRRLVKGHDGAPDQIVTTVELDGAFLLKTLKLASDLQHQATEVTPVQKHEHSGPDGGPIVTASLTADEYAQMRRKAEDRAQQFEEDLLRDDDGDSAHNPESR